MAELTVNGVRLHHVESGVGERDVAFRPHKAHCVTSAIPTARRHVLPGSGHLAASELTEAAGELIDAFVLALLGDPR